jgi:hypothetical protein
MAVVLKQTVIAGVLFKKILIERGVIVGILLMRNVLKRAMITRILLGRKAISLRCKKWRGIRVQQYRDAGING